MTSKPILIVDIALPDERETALFGKFSDWFARAIEADSPVQETLSLSVEEAQPAALAEIP